MSIPQTQATLVIDDAFIGRRVHQLMWDKHMTQTELGAALSMDQSTVAKRLRGKVGWPATLLVRTAEVLGSTVAYLVGEADSPEPTAPVDPAGTDGTLRTDNLHGTVTYVDFQRRELIGA